MNKLSSLALLVTYQCNVECKHCGLNCSPNNKEWMSLDEMKKLAIDSSKLGASSIILTGGEPSLIKHDDLCDYFRFVKENTAISNIRIVTNGHWAKSYDKAFQILCEWKEAGLDELNVSCGEFHQEYIPLKNIGFVYKAGCDINFNTVLLAGEFTTSSCKGKLSLNDFENGLNCRAIKGADLNPFSSSKHAFMCNSALNFGRGQHHIRNEDIPKIKYENLPNLCVDAISTLSCHPDGNVTICCGVAAPSLPFLSIGNWREEDLSVISERANDDFISNIIRYFGLKSFMERIKKNVNLKMHPKSSYSGNCELCIELFSNKDVLDYIVSKDLELEDDIIARKIIINSTANSSKYVYKT